MVKDLDLLKKTLIEYAKVECLQNKCEGFIINFDGTLMSLVNAALLKDMKLFPATVVVNIFNQNKYYLTQLRLMLSQLKINYIEKDLTKDFDIISLYQNNKAGDVKLEIALKKRLTDLACDMEADKANALVVSNLSKSQWMIDYPHKNYKNLNHLHLLGSMWYSELKQLARHLKISEVLINREPSYYLYRNQKDENILGFTYDELEGFCRGSMKPSSTIELTMSHNLASKDNKHFMIPPITRPSNILG